ncbi:hypothetical protein CGMCC3_g7854 [Colletotrichum fructicola]|nr:uncharacterized protein CGMCC3_g7854 [Colletotrichum fructicola]KAE9576075.1 hypothetical protein CGMCC3_g7854 [Colletotrichum fructicola]
MKCQAGKSGETLAIRPHAVALHHIGIGVLGLSGLRRQSAFIDA